MIKKLFESLTLSDEDKLEIKIFYDKYHKNSIEPLTDEAYNEFSVSGRRIGYEKLYFDRRRRIDGCFMMYKAYGSEYLAELCSLLYAVCKERTWALPAHTLNSENPREEIDLFAAETSQTLTEISYLLGNVLPSDLKNKIDYEVRSRVTDVFEKRRFGWESANSNWSAVCGGCIGMVYLYNRKPVPKRIFDALDCYLSGIKDDGVCLEGVGYWSYGFGYYMYFSSLLKERTGIDIISSPKVNALAHFSQNAYLGQCAVSCSDCMSDVSPSKGLTGILGKYFDGIYAPLKRAAHYDDCGRWADYIRSYLYPLPKQTETKGEFIYPLSQWYINKKNHFSFFIKGGDNSEPHNHNDVGSFIIADGERQLLCDIGCGEYTEDYFNPDTRYGYLCTSSLGHSLPIINGKAQICGSAAKAEYFKAGISSVSMEIGAAYSPFTKLKRSVKISDNSVILRDVFGSENEITERFVTKIKPRSSGDKIIIGSLSMPVPDKITKANYSNHYGIQETVYLLDYNVNNNIFEIIFSINKK